METLGPQRLRDAAATYDEREPFERVEQERLDTLPDAFADGSYLWKDAEWVVRWYARRPLDGRHQAREARFRDNAMAAIESAIDAAQAADDPVDAVNAMIALDGVDVPVASAFLYFMDPERFIPASAHTWRLLAGAGLLAHDWPDAVTPSDYVRFLEACRSLASTTGISLVEVERGLWQLADPRA